LFTGIIDHCGKVLQLNQFQHSAILKIKSEFSDLILGESIAVDGICLTVTQIENSVFTCDISSETLRVTTAGQFQIGQNVNLERALLPTTRMGGHFVMGHIDTTANVARIQQQGEFTELEIEGLTPEFLVYLVPKGSISVNGVSLTINQVSPAGFTVMLVPHTLAKTNLKNLKTQIKVNLEFDLLARFIATHYKNNYTEAL